MKERIGAYWADQYKKTRGICYPGHKKHEWIELERVTKAYGQSLIRWCIWKFLRSYEDDSWISTAQGWSLFAFSTRLPGLMIQARERKSERQSKGFARDLEAHPELDELANQLELLSFPDMKAQP